MLLGEARIIGELDLDDARRQIGRVLRCDNPRLLSQARLLGAQLARLEAQTVFTEVLRRWPDYRVLDGVEGEESTLLRATAKLPILLQP